MKTVYVVKGGQDVKGIKLDSRQEYILTAKGKIISILTNGYETHFVNNKYIKWPGRK